MNQDSDILAFLSKKNAQLQQFLQTVQKHRSVTLFSKGRRSELKDSGNMPIGRAEGNEFEAGVVAEGTWRSSTWNLRNWKLFLKNRYIRSINLYSQRLKVIEARLFPGSIVQLTRFYIVQDLTTKWLIWEMDKLINSLEMLGTATQGIKQPLRTLSFMCHSVGNTEICIKNYKEASQSQRLLLLQSSAVLYVFTIFIIL